MSEYIKWSTFSVINDISLYELHGFIDETDRLKTHLAGQYIDTHDISSIGPDYIVWKLKNNWVTSYIDASTSTHDVNNDSWKQINSGDKITAHDGYWIKYRLCKKASSGPSEPEPEPEPEPEAVVYEQPQIPDAETFYNMISIIDSFYNYTDLYHMYWEKNAYNTDQITLLVDDNTVRMTVIGTMVHQIGASKNPIDWYRNRSAPILFTFNFDDADNTWTYDYDYNDEILLDGDTH